MTDQSISELHDELADAVERGEVGRAADLQAELDDATPPVPDLVDEFETAVENGEVEKAKTLTRKISTRLSEKRVEQVQTLKQAIQARDQPDVSTEQARNLQEYVRSITSLSLERNGFLTSSASMLSEFEQLSAAERQQSTETASRLKDAEQTTDDAQSSAEETAEEATLPPNVALVSASAPDLTLAVGQSTTVDVQFSNVGDETAEDIEVTVSSRAGLAFNGTRKTVSEVPGGQSIRLGFEVEADEPGTYTVSFHLSSANGGEDSRDVTIEVKASTTDPVETIAGDNRTVEFQEVLEAISLYNQDKPVPDTDGATLAFQDVLRVIALFNEEGSV